VSEDWRQLCLYNGESTTHAAMVEVPLMRISFTHIPDPDLEQD